jgi:hypothetical protein
MNYKIFVISFVNNSKRSIGADRVGYSYLP